MQVSHLDDRSDLMREFVSEFEAGECWGYNRFYRIELLVCYIIDAVNQSSLISWWSLNRLLLELPSQEKDGYIDEEGTITLRFGVRAPTFAQQSRDQARYVVFQHSCPRSYVGPLPTGTSKH